MKPQPPNITDRAGQGGALLPACPPGAFMGSEGAFENSPAFHPPNPRNNTFYALKPHPTITQYIAADRRLVGRVTPCAPLLASKRTSFLQPPPSQCFTLKKHIMQVPAFTTCYVRSQSAQDAGRDATGFPLPSTGRGIEGEGWSYPELPPVSSCINAIPRPGLTLKKQIMQVTAFTKCCVCSQSAQDAGRVATGFFLHPA